MSPPPPPPTPPPPPLSTRTVNSSSSSVSPLPLVPLSSSSTPSSSNNLDYLWIPLLIGLYKELSSSAASRSTSPSLLLPSDADEFHKVPTCRAVDVELNYRPVIGILSHPGDGASGRLNKATNASYIAASYVKFVESAGARVIPLIYNEPKEILYQLYLVIASSVEMC